MAKQTTGEFLSLLRKAAGYTQEDVAEKLNISNRTISSWETDRTMPDVLLLPAIADMYGVTVDEILRGERAQPDKNIDSGLTEKTLKASRKNKFGKFSVRCNLLCSIACLFAVVIFIASLFVIFRVDMWAIILMFIIGFTGVAVCLIITTYLANSVKLSEGIVYKDDFNEENKSLALALSQKIWNFLTICSLPLLFSTLFFIILSIIYGLQWVLLMNAAPLLILLLASVLYRRRGIKKYANAQIFKAYNSNEKLLLKISGIGLIPLFAVLAAYGIVLIHCDVKTLAQSKTYQEFANDIQTIEITDGDGISDYIANGKYVLQFPANGMDNLEYDLGNGFKGVKTRNLYWQIYIIDNDANKIPVKDCRFYIFTIVSDMQKEIVNIKYRYYETSSFYTNINAWYSEDDNVYLFNVWYSDSVFILATCILTFIIAAEIAAIIAIYHCKRKKTVIEF